METFEDYLWCEALVWNMHNTGDWWTMPEELLDEYGITEDASDPLDFPFNESWDDTNPEHLAAWERLEQGRE